MTKPKRTNERITIAIGLEIHFEDNISLIPADFYTENTLVIITPAVPISHSEWNYFIERNFNIKKVLKF
jgi:UDP-N-acetylmuramate--alanine ligase